MRITYYLSVDVPDVIEPDVHAAPQQEGRGAVGWCPICRMNNAPMPVTFKPDDWPVCLDCGTRLELMVV